MSVMISRKNHFKSYVDKKFALMPSSSYPSHLSFCFTWSFFYHQWKLVAISNSPKIWKFWRLPITSRLALSTTMGIFHSLTFNLFLFLKNQKIQLEIPCNSIEWYFFLILTFYMGSYVVATPSCYGGLFWPNVN
jgi:hypothetical protein